MRYAKRGGMIKIIALTLAVAFFSQQVAWADTVDLRDDADFGDYALAIAAGAISGLTMKASWGIVQMFVYTYLIPLAADKLTEGIDNPYLRAGASALISGVAVGALDSRFSADNLKNIEKEGGETLAKNSAANSTTNSAANSTTQQATNETLKNTAEETTEETLKNAAEETTEGTAEETAEGTTKKLGDKAKDVGETVTREAAEQYARESSNIFVRIAQAQTDFLRGINTLLKPLSKTISRIGEMINKSTEALKKLIKPATDAIAPLTDAVTKPVTNALETATKGLASEGTKELTKEQIAELAKQVTRKTIIKGALTTGMQHAAAAVVGEYADRQGWGGWGYLAKVVVAQAVQGSMEAALGVTAVSHPDAGPLYVESESSSVWEGAVEALRNEDFVRTLAAEGVRLAVEEIGRSCGVNELLLSSVGKSLSDSVKKKNASSEDLFWGSVRNGAMSVALQYLSLQTKSPVHGAIFLQGVSSLIEFAVIDEKNVVGGEKDFALLRDILTKNTSSVNANIYTFGRADAKQPGDLGYGGADGDTLALNWTSGNDAFFAARYTDYQQQLRASEDNGLSSALAYQFTSAHFYQAVRTTSNIVSGEVNQKIYMRVNNYSIEQLADSRMQTEAQLQSLLDTIGNIEGAIIGELGADTREQAIEMLVEIQRMKQEEIAYQEKEEVELAKNEPVPKEAKSPEEKGPSLISKVKDGIKDYFTSPPGSPLGQETAKEEKKELSPQEMELKNIDAKLQILRAIDASKKLIGSSEKEIVRSVKENVKQRLGIDLNANNKAELKEELGGIINKLTDKGVKLPEGKYALEDLSPEQLTVHAIREELRNNFEVGPIVRGAIKNFGLNAVVSLKKVALPVLAATLPILDTSSDSPSPYNLLQLVAATPDKNPVEEVNKSVVELKAAINEAPADLLPSAEKEALIGSLNNAQSSVDEYLNIYRGIMMGNSFQIVDKDEEKETEESVNSSLPAIPKEEVTESSFSLGSGIEPSQLPSLKESKDIVEQVEASQGKINQFRDDNDETAANIESGPMPVATASRDNAITNAFRYLEGRVENIFK